MEVNSMPQIKSAIKRVRTAAKNNKRNAAGLSELRSAEKKFRVAQAAGEENASDLHRAAIRAIDKAASKGFISKNKASRDKSRLAKLTK